MDETKPDRKEVQEEVLCPPSVPEDLWELVPTERRREFLEAAAVNLRRAIHPETTVLEMLDAIGTGRPKPPAVPPPAAAVPFRPPSGFRPPPR